MTDYNDGKWHVWDGKKCPVHGDSQVDIIWPSIMANGGHTVRRLSQLAKYFFWDTSVVGVPYIFRVVKAYSEPKEYTIDPRKNIMWYSYEDELVHVKELVK